MLPSSFIKQARQQNLQLVTDLWHCLWIHTLLHENKLEKNKVLVIAEVLNWFISNSWEGVDPENRDGSYRRRS